MELIGQRVIHREKYGWGVIIARDDDYVTIRFEQNGRQKKFFYPTCFKRELTLMDYNAAAYMVRENDRIDKERQEYIQRWKLAGQEKKYTEITGAPSLAKKEAVPLQNSNIKSDTACRYSEETYGLTAERIADNESEENLIEKFFDTQVEMLRREIAYLNDKGGKRIKLFDGKLVDEKKGVHIYSFESDFELNLPDETLISLWKNTAKEGIPATAVTCEDFTIIIETKAYLGETVSAIEFSAEPWRLIQYLIDRLNTVLENVSPIVRDIICNGRKNISRHETFARSQETACKMSQSQPITVIWGPPGTGKTETLAKIVLQHIQMGKRVLMVSYSNVSVDGAIWRVFRNDSDPRPGKLVRYGYPRDKELLQHEYLTSFNLVLKGHRDLWREQRRLSEERRHCKRESSRYVDISQRLVQIKNHLDEEERAAVGKAAFVATTVSKAIADSTLYERRFDTVIFDEASMAYVSQILFSAGLAREHFVCLGDFAQLPPIVQSKDNPLDEDIFNYSGITTAVNNGFGHKWLCMLDTQYRMHPEIADFASKAMYHGFLKSGADMEEKRHADAVARPFSGRVLQLADLSGMLSVCLKTTDNSRFNLLSAIISMGLAVNGAQTREVGIITPYNAQSRLLHAMERDILEQMPKLQKISCATVHQFQGSEKDIIIYDAVDCFRMPYPGVLLSQIKNNYANRLFNVALTRARGKMVSVVNADYMRRKKLSSNLVFRQLINTLIDNGRISQGERVLQAANSQMIRFFTYREAIEALERDIDRAQKEIHFDLPWKSNKRNTAFLTLESAIKRAIGRGVKVFIRTPEKESIPVSLQSRITRDRYIANPVTMIDRRWTWYGIPPTNVTFVSDGEVIPTKYQPIARIEGKHFAQALYGFLEMNMIPGALGATGMVPETRKNATAANPERKQIVEQSPKGDDTSDLLEESLNVRLSKDPSSITMVKDNKIDIKTLNIWKHNKPHKKKTEKGIGSVAHSSDKNSDGTYVSFRAYVAGELRCPKCGKPLHLMKNPHRRFYFKCSNPKCAVTHLITVGAVEKYLATKGKYGMLCPKDNTSLEAVLGKDGIYVKCNNELDMHFYSLDKI